MAAVSAIEYFIGKLFTQVFGNSLILGLVAAFLLVVLFIVLGLDRNFALILGALAGIFLTHFAMLPAWAEILIDIVLALLIIFSVRTLLSGGGYG